MEKGNTDTISIPHHLEHMGFEPMASTMPLWRAPSCANAPIGVIIAWYVSGNKIFLL